ncbi:hydantoinase B/oxoprolinase family protein [Roseiarcaceae bacterium H3SJ34-1]|uniref:hydantoinase B/oxoprolinase family protein n=1 Tax=Terripilifer ovatus TaxID=3032367 RepID=UPI003AB9561D|nr:hydantoinase B/oxoprolinase family protein [Roseiarcaceae bacterium H3SJ34-1]
MKDQATKVDPITLEVIRHGVVAIANQIDANITRTAFSPFIYEYKDYAVGLIDAQGRIVAQNTGGMPIFVADSVGMAAREGLRVYGADSMRHGDVILCNDPLVQGQHLNNVVMYTPVRIGERRERLIGFFAINMHWMDIGGSVPRSTDIFMEGLQLPTVKLWQEGRRNDDLYRLIARNSRFPTELLGDIEAQLAGCLLGRDLLADLADRYGVEDYEAAVDALLDQSEAASRARIAAMPAGEYTAHAMLDGDGESDTPLPITVRVRVHGSELTVDYSGLPPQVAGCINAGYFGGGLTTARVGFKYLMGSDEPANEGTFRPLKLILPPNTLLSGSPTAPIGNYNRSFPTVIDAVIRAFEHVLPQHVTGGHFGTFAVLRMQGRRLSGAHLDFIDGGYGGWGAGAGHDGSGPYRTMAHGDTRVVPIELQEALYPFMVEEFALRQDSGGAGEYRGGLGLLKSYRITEPLNIRVDFDRLRCPPWGVCGGKDAKSGWVTVHKSSGEVITLYKTKAHPVQPGDVICMEVGGGGGYGPPERRSRDLVSRDIARGYISKEAARSDYGFDG